mgnify:CR=1 FL=1
MILRQATLKQIVNKMNKEKDLNKAKDLFKDYIALKDAPILDSEVIKTKGLIIQGV